MFQCEILCKSIGWCDNYSSNVVRTQPVQMYTIKALDPLW